MGEIKIKIDDKEKQITGAYVVIDGQVKELLWECIINGKIEDFIKYVESITQNITLDETSNQSRTYNLTVDNLVSVDSILVDTGKVSYSINENVITINTTGGTARSVYNSKKYSKIVTDYSTSSSNSFPSAKSYNDGSYSGALYKDGNSYVSSGSYTPAGTRREIKTISGYNYSGGIPPIEEPFATTWHVKSAGYKNPTIISQGYTSPDEAGEFTWNGQTYRHRRYGSVTFNYDVDVSASDTRVYRQNYKGTAYKVGYDSYYSYKIDITYTKKKN